MQVPCGPPLEPIDGILGHPVKPLTHQDPQSCPGHSSVDYLHGSHFSPNGTSATDSAGSSTTLDSSIFAGDEEESLVDSQPICFKENPFLVANRKGKGRPPGEQILSGPPVGYGRHGQLQPWLFSKARRRGPSVLLEAAWCDFGVHSLFGLARWCHLTNRDTRPSAKLPFNTITSVTGDKTHFLTRASSACSCCGKIPPECQLNWGAIFFFVAVSRDQP